MAARKRLLVGVAIDATTGYGRQIMRGVMQYANLERRWMLLEEFRATEADFTSWPRCDGAIVTVSDAGRLKQIAARARHIICCSGAADIHRVDVVCVDSRSIGKLAANHLMDCRLTHFGFYGAPGLRHSEERLAGFQATLAQRGFKCSIAPLVYSFKGQVGTGKQSHWPKLVSWIHSLPKPIGILTLDDMAAHDLTAACLNANVLIPEQVAVVGVNNDDLLCDSAWPPLSSINADYQRAGFVAAQRLDRLMLGTERAGKPQLIELPPAGVVVRASTDVLAVDDPQIAAAVRFIREHACDPCSVSDILRTIPVGRRWLERQFIQKLGRSPHEEINHVRIETARRLLLRPEITLIDVAERCGFSTVQSFSRAFHQSTGENPGAFRRARLQKAMS